MQQCILTAFGWRTASEAVGLQLAPIREHRHLGVAEEFDFTDDAISTGILPLAPRVMADGILRDPERKGVFQSLDGRVQRIRHVRMRGVHTWQTGPAARTTSNGLIVCVMLI